jgi:hypothetical protein
MTLFPIHSLRENSRISILNANMRSKSLNMRKKPVAPAVPVAPVSEPTVVSTKTASSPINKILKAIIPKKS